jgi:hypothetical protein
VDTRKACRISDSRAGEITRFDEYETYIDFFIEANERVLEMPSDRN